MQLDLKDHVTRVIYFTLNLLEELKNSPSTVDAKECRDNLLGLLDAVRSVEAPPETVASIQYALTAWVDELISRTNWTYARAWDAHPLETVLFGTEIRRWRFFELAEEAQSRQDYDALLVFQFCVKFGFRGIYAKQRVKLRAAARLPFLRHRESSRMPQATVLKPVIPGVETAPGRATGRSGRRYGPLLPATLSDWCNKTFAALKGNGTHLGAIAMPRLFERVFSIRRVVVDWAIVAAIGLLLSAVLFAMGH